MGKKTAYRRRSYRRYYRRYRSVSNQYFPCRVEGVYTIAYPSDAGSPLFYDTAGNVSYVVEAPGEETEKAPTTWSVLVGPHPCEFIVLTYFLLALVPKKRELLSATSSL